MQSPKNEGKSVLVEPKSVPPRLYKYRSVSGSSRALSEAILRGNKVWYARASSFNDPFDCNHHIRTDMTQKQWRDLFGQFERAVSGGVGELIGRMLGGLLGAIINPAVDKGVLPESLRTGPEQGGRLGRRIGERGELSLSGKRVTKIPAGKLADDDGVLRPAREILNRRYQALVNAARKDIDGRYGVLSLSAVPDNILMWSHYADNHRGICIEFDTSRYSDAFPNLDPVQYTKASPVFTQKFANILLNVTASELPNLEEVLLELISKQDVGERWTAEEVRAWFLTKSSFWAYEREWRSLKSKSGEIEIPASSISRVIVGCVDSEATLALVRPWIEARPEKVALHRAVKKDDAFALDIVPVD